MTDSFPIDYLDIKKLETFDLLLNFQYKFLSIPFHLNETESLFFAISSGLRYLEDPLTFFEEIAFQDDNLVLAYDAQIKERLDSYL